jgi:hypothetical protein
MNLSAERAIREAIGENYGIAVWNDAPGRMFSDVIEMLDRAEKIAEQTEQRR